MRNLELGAAMRTPDRAHLAVRFRVLRSPLFCVSLCLLLANDLYLKGQLSNWLTGKLSDFSGLVVASLLAFSMFGRSPRMATIVIGLAFAWWKSPLSDTFIAFVNSLSAFQLGRVVDYSDLVALLVLPIALRVYQADDRRPNTERINPLVLWPLLAVTMVAITGTSALPLAREFAVRPKDSGAVLAESTIDEIAAPVLQHYRCEMSAPRRCETKKFSVEYGVSATEVSFVIRGSVPVLGSNGYVRDAEKLVADLKSAFAAQVPGLEFVENLDAHFCRERVTTGCSGR